MICSVIDKTYTNIELQYLKWCYKFIILCSEDDELQSVLQEHCGRWYMFPNFCACLDGLCTYTLYIL